MSDAVDAALDAAVGAAPHADAAPLDMARAVADAVLYEGYVLYPYRASAQKNQIRWQWGVLMPPSLGQDSGERSTCQTECLLEPRGGCQVRVVLRFLQVQHKGVEQRTGDEHRPVGTLRVGAEVLSTWDEGLDHEPPFSWPLEALLDAPRTVPVEVDGGEEIQILTDADGVPVGRIVRRRWPLSALVRVSAVRLPGPYGAVRLRVVVDNVSSAQADTREDALRHALVAAHLLLGVDDGAFLSLLEPPVWASGFAKECEQAGVWPVLAGPEGSGEAVLASPIILYDHPGIAPESPGELYDGLEIDEILTLRTMALTEEEKREARGTDPRAAELIDRVDAMPQELLDRLHGAVRYLEDVTGASVRAVGADTEVTGPGGDPRVPWWDPGADASVSPWTDSIVISGVEVAKGSTVRLRPTLRGSDAQDMFLVGRSANVEGVFLDVDGNTHVAVTLVDDPAAELEQWQGRFRYFHPEEVEPL